jgi:D-psicose/D-tagatose/L-ribulose 3-epimerase
MFFGANSFIWTETFGTDQFNLLHRIKDAGLDGIEFGILNPRQFQAVPIRRELERLELISTSCCVVPPDGALCSLDIDDRRRGKTHIKACLETTAETGSRLLCGPLYAPLGHFTGTRRTADEWKRIVESWQELAQFANTVHVEVALEPLNRFETYVLNTVRDAVQLCAEIDDHGVGVLIDTFHANIEEKNIGQALCEAGKYLKHIHTSENDRGTPGTGNVDWPDFFKKIKEIQYDRWMVVESFGFSLGSLSAAASIWRDLAPSLEEIPFEGVKFLKEMSLK